MGVRWKNASALTRKGILELTNVQFHDDGHLLRIIDRIVSQVGRRVDESNPMVDARLSDGSRVNAIIPPLAVDGALLSIRRFGTWLPNGRDIATAAQTAVYRSSSLARRLGVEELWIAFNGWWPERGAALRTATDFAWIRKTANAVRHSP